MSEPGPGDLYLARVVRNRATRWTIYAVFLITATASLIYRVVLGRTLQVLPWYGALLCLYGFGMALVSRDPRCRLVYGAFGVVVATAFTRGFWEGQTRVIGVIEVVACLAILAGVGRLGADPEFRRRGAVLESSASQHTRDREDPDD